MFKAILYGPNLPIAGSSVDAEFVGTRLWLRDSAVSIDVSGVSVTMDGFDHTELFLNWQNEVGETFSLKPINQTDISYVIESAPASLHQFFVRWRNRKRRIRAVWTTILTSLGGLTLSAVLVWWNYDTVVLWLANHVSVENEQRIGNSILKQIKAEGNVVEKGPAVDAIKHIGDKLTKGSRYTYQWVIQKDKSVNAFALPGGIVVVNAGLIQKADNADEVAAVLAHEMQHVEQRHSLQSMIHSLGWATLLVVVLGDVNVATAVVVHQLGNVYFSRDKEDEADRLCVEALRKANITLQGMPNFLKKLEDLYGSNDMMVWMSSHPSTSDRILAIEKIIKETPCTSCKPLEIDWAKIKADKALKNTD